MDVHISERYSKSSLCFHKYHTWMTLCMESCTQSTVAASYKWFLKHRAGRPAIDAQPNRMLYVFFWVIPRRLNFICRRFGTLYLFQLHRQVGK